MLRKVAIALCQRFFLMLVSSQVRDPKQYRGAPRYFFFDIDNTLADAWPSFLIPWKSQQERVASLAVFMGMHRWVSSLQQYPNNKIFFITARSYTTWLITRNWLRSNGLNATWSNTIITNSPEEKLGIIRQTTAPGNHVYWIDDLSYNHEHGEVRYYSHLIERIKETRIRYFGASTIKHINQS